MQRSIRLPFLAILLSAVSATAADLPPEDDDSRALIQQAQRRVLAWHGAEAGSASNVIRVVYFHPANRKPLSDWQARTQRILHDVSDFYRDGKELYRSETLRAGTQSFVKVPVAGVERLELLTEGGEDHVHSSWAIWVNPVVNR